MPRPPMALGTWGEIRVYPTRTDVRGKPDRFRAVSYYRDFDGRTRQLQRRGNTRAAAVNNLKIMLKERAAVARDGELTTAHRFREAASLWLDKVAALVADDRRSPGTLETYRRQLSRHVIPALGELRLGEVTTPLVDKFIGKVKTEVGPATARTCRSIVSGIMSLAVRYGAVVANPVREVDRVEGSTKKEPRALTEAERVAWIVRLAADEDAVRKDLLDLTAFLLATGCRIGEALAVLWSEADFKAESVAITSTIIRVTGVGLVRKRTKSRAGQRVLPLPSWAVSMLRRRFMDNVRLDQPVFPDSLGEFRDPSNVQRDLRSARGTKEMAWVTSHSFRKTTATILDDAGLSSRLVADQLGHSRPSMTQDVYLGRKLSDNRAAAALEAALGQHPDETHG
jgi:integrase